MFDFWHATAWPWLHIWVPATGDEHGNATNDSLGISVHDFGYLADGVTGLIEGRELVFIVLAPRLIVECRGEAVLVSPCDNRLIGSLAYLGYFCSGYLAEALGDELDFFS